MLAGRYRIVERLGSGGMATVFRATDERLDRSVAVKLLPAELSDDPRAARRIVREAQAAAALSHPNVAAVFDILEEPGVVGLVMEEVPGRTLGELLAEGGPMDVSDATRIIQQVCAGVAAAHAAGIIHRDLKPSNVVVTTEGIVKIVDFGIAGSLGAGDMTTTIRGSVPYVAPEQAAGQAADERADVYAVGCMLYEALVGRPPFTGTPVEVLAQHATATPPLPSGSRQGVPLAIDRVVARAMAKDPADRFPGAHQLADALRDGDTLPPDPARDATRVLPAPSADETVVIARPASKIPGPAIPVVGARSRLHPSRSRNERFLVGGSLLGLVVVVLVAVWLVPAGTPTSSPTEQDVEGSPSATPAPGAAATPTSFEEGIDALAAAVADADTADVSDEASEKLAERIRDLRKELRQGPPDERGEEADEQLEKLEEELANLDEEGHISGSFAETLWRLLDQMWALSS